MPCELRYQFVIFRFADRKQRAECCAVLCCAIVDTLANRLALTDREKKMEKEKVELLEAFENSIDQDAIDALTDEQVTDVLAILEKAGY